MHVRRRIIEGFRQTLGTRRKLVSLLPVMQSPQVIICQIRYLSAANR